MSLELWRMILRKQEMSSSSKDQTEPIERPVTKATKSVSSCSFGKYDPAKVVDVAKAYINFSTLESHARGTKAIGVYVFDQYATAARIEAAVRSIQSNKGLPWVEIHILRLPKEQERKSGQMKVTYRGANPKRREDVCPLLSETMTVALMGAILRSAPQRRGAQTMADALKVTLLQPHEMAARWPPLLWSLYHQASVQKLEFGEHREKLLRETIKKLTSTEEVL
uniref:Uncharacterized protein n=1 Tax=Compsopogon caeruleus TaxID=31354 RepID=A0A7S1TIT4_9RHOD|mmetsp:Transcript_9300/g.18971  ORF Transcript_9300/g.18971 Transcript_9300/m.18971 type:complete len:224 (+) Transcript_9300:1309-1980(+)